MRHLASFLFFIFATVNLPYCQISQKITNSTKMNCTDKIKYTKNELFKILGRQKEDTRTIIQQEIFCSRNNLNNRSIKEYLSLIDKEYESYFKDVKKSKNSMSDFILFINLSKMLRDTERIN